jgi:hypothetical protein
MPAITPGKGIRYPLFSEAGDPQAVMAMVFDLDTMATADDALRATALTRRGARITNTTAPNITKSVYTKLTYDTVNWDPLGLTNLGVNNDRFTIPPAWPGCGCSACCGRSTRRLRRPGHLLRRGDRGQEHHRGAGRTELPPAQVPRLHRGGVRHRDCLCTAPMVMAGGDFVTSGGLLAGDGRRSCDQLGAAHLLWAFPLALS